MRTAINLLFPPVCVGCHETQKEHSLCHRCQDTLRPLSAPLCPHCDRRVPGGELRLQCRSTLRIRHIAVAYPYGHPMAKAAIDALKYEGIRDLAPFLGNALAQAMTQQWGELPQNTVFIPIPLHKTRLQERGFNQAALITETATTRLGASVQTNILARKHPTKPQVGLGSAERKENIVGAFTAQDADPAAAYILVDDVTTTGSTIRAAAAALREAGARNVSAATVAQG